MHRNINIKRILIMTGAAMLGLIAAYAIVIGVEANRTKDIQKADYDSLQQLYENDDSFRKSFDKSIKSEDGTKVTLEGNTIVITTNVGKKENTEKNRASQKKKADSAISESKVKSTIKSLEKQVGIEGIAVEYRYVNNKKETLYSVKFT